MDEDLKQRLADRSIWLRGLAMLLFVLIYSLAEAVIAFLVLFQFFAVLITGSANAPLLRFGSNMAEYVYQILAFQTFNSEVLPFPFSDWPDEPARGDVWLAPDDMDDDIADVSPDRHQDDRTDPEDAPENPRNPAD